MAMMSTLIAAMSSLYPEANPAFNGPNVYNNKKERNKHIYRLIGTATTLAANCYRHKLG